jgi:hypothetical protein
MEWLDAKDLDKMIRFLRDRDTSERKLRLFAVECVRAIRPHLHDERSVRALEFVDANAERPFKGLRGRRQIESAAAEADPGVVIAAPDSQNPDEFNESKVRADAAYAARALLDTAWVAALHSGHFAVKVLFVIAIAKCGSSDLVSRAVAGETAGIRQHQRNVSWLRDIFGNPFRPVAFDPAWRTSTAVALAKHMYESRDFSPMPILADALQDAGCDCDDILTHCRDATASHVRGCWVVDLVLDKQ